MKLIKIILWDFLNLRLNLGSYRLLIGLSLRFFFTKQYFENGGTLVKYNNYFALLQKQFSLVVLDEFPRKVAMSYLENIRPYFSSYYILNVLASFLYVLLKGGWTVRIDLGMSFYQKTFLLTSSVSFIFKWSLFISWQQIIRYVYTWGRDFSYMYIYMKQYFLVNICQDIWMYQVVFKIF